MDVAGAMQGFETFAFNNAVRRYERTGEIDVSEDYTDTTDAGVALRSNYSFGNQAAVDQARSIADGTDLLRVGGKLSDDEDGNHLGLTTIENGRRVVHLATLGKEGDIASQLQAGTVLQWEAHRDGTVGTYNQQLRESTFAAKAAYTMATAIDKSARYGQVFDLSAQQQAIGAALARGGLMALGRHVADRYDFTSGDNLLHRTDGRIALDGSTNLNWQAVMKDYGFKQIMELEGTNEQESLVQLVGGDEQARQMLADKGVKLSGDESPEELGNLLIDTFGDEKNPSVLNIAYDQLHLNRDWQGMYASYTKNQAFFDSQTWIAGHPEDLKAANQGDDVTTKLEYYTVVHDPLQKALVSQFGLSNPKIDPLQYLVDNTTVIQPTMANGLDRSIRLHNSMVDDFTAGLKNTVAQGGVVPPHSGGLTMRFIDNVHEGQQRGLYLSNHATGRAFDMDYDNNKQYFVPAALANDPYYTSYVQDRMGIAPNAARGWEQNRQLAELTRRFPQYLEDRETHLASTIVRLRRNSSLSNLIPHFKYELEQITAFKDQNIDVPRLRFGMDQTFVENMRQRFDWGGDWWRQKDYTHFQQR